MNTTVIIHIHIYIYIYIYIYIIKSKCYKGLISDVRRTRISGPYHVFLRAADSSY